jgi:hypothetical protein
MSLQILQPKSCTGACANCKKLPQPTRATCDPHSACAGYGTAEQCPPLIVLAVFDQALRNLAAEPAGTALRLAA